jgi:hypothetical protein
VQVVCLRPRVAHPQLLATSRHVTCGGPDLSEVVWRDNTLSGVSELVAGDPYELYLNETDGYRFVGVDVDGARVVSQKRDGSTRVLLFMSEQGGLVHWKVRYRSIR